MKINKQSRLYHFIDTYACLCSNMHAYDVRDVCSLVRAFIYACCSVFLLIMVGTLLGAFIIHAVIGIYFAITTTLSIWDMPAAITFIGLIALICVGVIGNFVEQKRKKYLADKHHNELLSGASPKQPSLIKTLYQGFRDKTCILVEFVDKK